MNPSALNVTLCTMTMAPDVGYTPPLENGDRLTRAEFERRYALMPQVKKAELIEGVVYMQPWVSTHGLGFAWKRRSRSDDRIVSIPRLRRHVPIRASRRSDRLRPSRRSTRPDP